MKKTVLGTDSDRKDLVIDVQRLIQTRMLVTAQSGAGKSWALRRILEQTHGQVQHLVIDPEGEFFTLREKFDYILAKPGGAGDCQAHPRSAGELATSLLEVGVSAIMDIYDLPPKERILFVKNFLEGLINAPKGLQHPALIVLDESQFFCPQDADAESSEAVWNLMVMGRKRGFCGLLAANRISMIHKNAVAQAGNYLIGRSTLDIDVKRVCGVLGFSTREDQTAVHRLGDGEFFAYGSALSREVTKIHVGAVATTHPKAGTNPRPVPTPAAVQKVLSKLQEIPQEAERKAQTLADMRTQLATVNRELREAKRAMPTADPDALGREYVRGETAATQRLARQIRALEESMKRFHAQISGYFEKGKAICESFKVETIDTETGVKSVTSSGPPRPAAPVKAAAPRPARSPSTTASTNGHVSKAGRKVLTALAQFGECPDTKVGALTGYSAGAGHFSNVLSDLRTPGYIEGERSALRITDAGMDALGPFDPLPTGPELQSYWMQRLPKGSAEILRVLVEAYPESISDEELGERTGYSAKAGHFSNCLSELRTRDLISGGRSALRASEDLFS